METHQWSGVYAGVASLGSEQPAPEALRALVLRAPSARVVHRAATRTGGP